MKKIWYRSVDIRTRFRSDEMNQENQVDAGRVDAEEGVAQENQVVGIEEEEGVTQGEKDDAGGIDQEEGDDLGYVKTKWDEEVESN